MHKQFLAMAAALTMTAPLAAQSYVMMPDSTNNRVVLFDPFNGSLVNSNYFGLQGGTPVEALQVGNEIWVSTQIGDRIERYSLAGAPISNITGTYDNVRGISLIGSTVYMCNDGTGNGAPGPSVFMFDMAGNQTGFATLAPTTNGPFDVLAYGNNMLVSSDSANDDVHQYTLGGASVGTFHNTTGLNFAEQMDYDPTGNILVAGFSTNNVVTLNFNTGAIVSSFTASGARGVYQLGNGNVMWTNSGGTWIYDVTTQQSTQVYAGGGRFLNDLVIPGPGGAMLLGLGGLAIRRRRRI